MLEEIVDVRCAEEPAVKDQKELFHTEGHYFFHHVMKGGDIHDTTRIHFIHDRDTPVFIYNDGKVHLWKIQAIAVVPVFQHADLVGIRGERGDVVDECF